MSANHHQPHLLVIPEDDANRAIVNGLRNHLSIESHRIQVEHVAGGWRKALQTFAEDHIEPMQKYPARHVLILIDLDSSETRLEQAKNIVPAHLKSRVFIMGSQETPEKLSTALKMSKERLGEALADECLGRRVGVWSHEMLAHNAGELGRMQTTVCPSLLKR
jgi:hypothetical protein